MKTSSMKTERNVFGQVWCDFTALTIFCGEVTRLGRFGLCCADSHAQIGIQLFKITPHNSQIGPQLVKDYWYIGFGPYAHKAQIAVPSKQKWHIEDFRTCPYHVNHKSERYTSAFLVSQSSEESVTYIKHLNSILMISAER